MSKFTDKIKNDPLLKWGLISAFPLALLVQIPLMMADNAREIAEAKAAEAAKAEAEAARRAALVAPKPKPAKPAFNPACKGGKSYAWVRMTWENAYISHRNTFSLNHYDASRTADTHLRVNGVTCAREAGADAKFRSKTRRLYEGTFRF